jgi:hypothetical protein
VLGRKTSDGQAMPRRSLITVEDSLEELEEERVLENGC